MVKSGALGMHTVAAIAALLCCSSIHSARADSLMVEVIAQLELGFGPQWSPSGRFISMTARDSLRVVSADGMGHSMSVIPNLGQGYIWASDGEFVYRKKPSPRSATVIFELVSFCCPNDIQGHGSGFTVSSPVVLRSLIDGAEGQGRVYGPIRLVDGAIGFLRSIDPIYGSSTFVSFPDRKPMTEREKNWPWIYTTREGEENYSPWWRQVWMKPISAPIDSLGRKILTARCIGRPVVAPASDRVVTDCGGHWLIFDTSGTELNSSFQLVHSEDSTGLGVSAGDMQWSADGKYLAFTRMWEDDGMMVRIQACVCDVATNQVAVLGEDSGSHHASYAWSPNTNLLAISDGTNPIRILRISGGAE